MTETPPWAASRSGSAGFTPPTPTQHSFPSELHLTWSGRPSDDVGRSRKSKIITIMLGALVVALVAAAGLLVWKALAPADVTAPVPAAEFQRPADGVAVGPSGVQPVAVEDDGGQPMTVATMAPNSLFIPALGIYMPVETSSTFVASKHAGFDTLRIPSNPKHGVRYGAGAPMYGGEAGTTLIASHVSTSSGWGALRYLYKLKGGELIYTKDATGQLQTWQMTRMRVEFHTDFPQEYWSAAGVRQLVVTTCGGKVSRGLFTQNIFAIAVPVDPKPATAAASA